MPSNSQHGSTRERRLGASRRRAGTFTTFIVASRTLSVMMRRALLSATALLAFAAAIAIGPPAQDRDGGGADAATRVVVAAAPDHPWAARLEEKATARREGDAETLAALMRSDDDVAAYRAARTLAGRDGAAPFAEDAPSLETPPELRLEAIERIFDLRIDEPLARVETRALQLARAEAAEAAGRLETAVAAYRAALPDATARDGLERLLEDPYERANAFHQGGLSSAALDALGGRAAPSIEAPALRAVGRHEEALEAYRRWLEQVPDASAALAGVAWSLWSLDRVDEAEAAFERLAPAERAYGLGLVANRRGDVGEAATQLRATGVPARLWLATTLLERAERWADALDVYLELAAGSSVYADDAAWRARVLAERIGDDAAREAAEARIPAGGYFDLRRGGTVRLPERDDLARVPTEGMEVVRWLAETGDDVAARQVAAFALREATAQAAQEPELDAETVGVPWAEALVALGEARIPQRAAAGWLAAGSDQLRTWRLAYPRAWPDVVEPAAERAGVDPELVWAVMRRESAFYPRAVSRSGAMGLMQVMPATWDWIAELLGEEPGDPFDPETNIRYGVHYLGWLDRYFDGDLELAVASYNRGQGYIGRLDASPEVAGDRDDLLRSIDALETREYLQAVWTTYRTYLALEELGPERF